jgi:hypothetical protein
VLPFVLAFFMVIFILLIIIAAVAWAIREHLTAKKYRYLIRIHNAMPQTPAHINKVGPQWRFTYKVKGKVTEIDVPAQTEGEAINKFIGEGRDYANIVKFSKL